MGTIVIKERLLEKIAVLIKQARGNVARAIDHEMALLYWSIGRILKEEIVKNKRAGYGEQVVQSISLQLTQDYGHGFSSQNLWHMVKFYEVYPILSALRRELGGLSWTHIKTIIYLSDKLKRAFYAILCKKEQWNTRMLEERINSMLYERTSLSRFPQKTIAMHLKALNSKDKITPELVFRDPYVLDFLELEDTYSEKDLESAILNALGKFILELGRDFYFVARQKRITIDNEDFYIDLLFYHRKLKCFVAMDLKLGRFKAEYKGQMELYLKYLEKYETKENENPPVGIILCAEKNREQIKLLFLPGDRIKVAEYLTKLPSKRLFKEKLHKAVQISNSR